MKAYFVLLALLYLPSSSCGAFEIDIPLLAIEGANWTKEEVAYIKAMNQKGSIKVATKISSAVYVPHEDGSHSGFHYKVLEEFANLVGIKIDGKIVTWNDYFYKQGEDLAR
ncbi:hypothetical protein CXF85_06150 [Colwellia sp. 75C3]|uniref:hypothetical protein n=1 Tax=Colwellia sp. 75C3 TaxID=888425 RepID=UPI000C344EDB|nr:hypothetical protein [Colwellia sp. 75C3]PKG85180.1 hypothetical protein CXF85_06150 [Colwellia sp. 75C3]